MFPVPVNHILEKYGLCLFYDAARNEYTYLFNTPTECDAFVANMAEYPLHVIKKSTDYEVLKEMIKEQLFYWNFCYVVDLSQWKKVCGLTEHHFSLPDEYLTKMAMYEIPENVSPVFFTAYSRRASSLALEVDLPLQTIFEDLCPSYEFTKVFLGEEAKTQAEDSIIKQIDELGAVLNSEHSNQFIEEILDFALDFAVKYSTEEQEECVE